MNKKDMLKSILKSVKELSISLEEIKKSIIALDFKKLPKLLEKEAQIIEKIEKYSETIKNLPYKHDINNMNRVGKVLPFPPVVKDIENTEEFYTLRQMYCELIRKVYIIGNLIEQHLVLYRMVYGNIISGVGSRAEPIYINKSL
jgi:hypothetical protein